MRLAYQAKDYKLLNEQIVLITKKRALLKQAVTKMVQEAILIVQETTALPLKLELIDTLRTVTEGKVVLFNGRSLSRSREQD